MNEIRETAGESFVGRRAERSRLSEHIRRTHGGHGGVTLLGGEAGAGKTALWQAVVAALESGPPAFVGRCPGPKETPPYGPWVEIVHRIGRELSWDTRALPRPFGESDGRKDADELAGALGHWLGRRGRPLVLVVEDIHWADAASLELLRHLTLFDWPVRVICTYRTDEISRSHPLWLLLPELQRRGAERILLERLTQADVAELTAKLVETPEAPRYADWIYERTDGLALFVRELLDLVARTGELPRPDDPLPQNLRQAIDSRLSRLDPAALAALEPAAVMGERFSFDVLLEVTDLGEDDLSAVLEAGITQRVIRPYGIDGNWFAFDHALFREAILYGLIGSRRRRLHARIAEALASSGSESDPDAIAFHLRQAGDPRAADHLIAAGDRARRLGVLAQAAERYDDALSIMGADDPRRPELLLLLGWCLRAHDADRAAKVLRSAVDVAEACGRAAVALWARHVLLLLGRINDPAQYHSEGSAIAAQEARWGEDPEYLRIEGELYGGPAGFPRTATSLIRNLALSGNPEKAADLLGEISVKALPSAGSDIAASRMVLTLLAGNLAEAAEQCGRAADLAYRARHYRQAIVFRANEIMIRLIGPADQPDRLDNLARQLESLEEEAWRQVGYAPLGRGFSLTGVYRYFRGDWRGGRRHVVECARNDPSAFGGTLAWYAASVLLNSGSPEAALPFAESVLPLRPDDPYATHHFLMVLPHSVRAEVYTALGDQGRALAWLESAERWPALTTAPFYRAYVLLARTSYHRARGELSSARECAETALDDARKAASSLLMIKSHRALGELAAAMGDARLARLHFEESLDVSQQVHFPFETALTRLARGRSGVGTAAERLADLNEALATFSAAGADPAVALVRSALAEADEPPGMPPSVPGIALTERQIEVIELVCEGLTDREIAARLFISPKTVDRHLRNIFNKTGVTNRAALAAYATRRGIAP